MTFGDLVGMSVGNLWRMKLRSFLTISGVVIAIAAFVAMLSFAAGVRDRASEEFYRFGLLSVMQVYPERQDDADTTKPAHLDDNAVKRISALPGVDMVFPYNAFDVTFTGIDTTIKSRAQALPPTAFATKLYSQLEAGSFFTSDSSDTIVVTSELLEDLGIEDAASLVGTNVVLAVEVTSIDSAIVAVIEGLRDRIGDRVRQFEFDSLLSGEYMRQMARTEFSEAIRRFSDGLFNRTATVADTFVVGGVLEALRGHRARMQPIIVPSQTARLFISAGSAMNPRDIMTALASGQAIDLSGASDTSRFYPQLTVNLDPNAAYQPIKDSVEAMGFRAYSLAESCEDMRRFFRYFNLGLSLIGLIALITASLGIVNTMVMSITERRREIGVMMSLGADLRDIRIVFLFESGMIGFLGGLLGIFVGWIISRISSMIAQAVMESQGADPMELFALPWWLIGIALAFGIIVSLVAGYYPAARAARIDPVRALRQE